MKKFLAVYLGSENTENMKKWEAQDQKSRQERTQAGIDAWMSWGMKNKKAIVYDGSPIGKTKLINKQGISETKNLITGYTIVQAESHEEAAKLFLNHPHFTIFPGESVEIMECLPIPEIN